MSLWGLAPWEAKTTVAIVSDPVVSRAISRGIYTCDDSGGMFKITNCDLERWQGV